MTKENALEWLEREEFNQWRLERADDAEKIADYTSKDENIQEGRERLVKILELLEPGKYRLKAYKGNGKQASQDALRFEILKPTNSQTPQNSKMNDAQLQALFDQAKKAALEEFRLEQYQKDTEKRFATLEKEIETLKNVIKDLHDDDPDNDDDALDKLSNFAAKVPDFANGFEAMKGMFTSK